MPKTDQPLPRAPVLLIGSDDALVTSLARNLQALGYDNDNAGARWPQPTVLDANLAEAAARLREKVGVQESDELRELGELVIGPATWEAVSTELRLQAMEKATADKPKAKPRRRRRASSSSS
jgi:peptidoglycan hydrolase-like protein with peptidoglycan-binding domain